MIHMVCELISVGTELLLGNIVNTNTQFLAEKCALLGLSSYYQVTVGDNRERLAELKKYGPRGRSKSITRFQKNGVRLSPDEIYDAIHADMEATIAADEYEVEVMERALAVVADDEYYPTVSGRYIEKLPDERVAEIIPCDASTVWRNRKRLVQQIAVWLYGADAVK